VSCASLPGCETSDPLRLRVNACVLAVEFDSYEAVRQDDGTVAVRWATLSEEESLGFEVQRATGPDGTFATIDGVAARGGGSIYELVDRDARGGESWYRVVEVTTSGPGDATPAFTLESTTGDRRATGGRGRAATRRVR